MPCNNGFSQQESNHQYNNPLLAMENSRLLQKNQYLEASLCAIITELEKRGIANEIISQASTNGLIDLMSFWKTHSKQDETRLAIELDKFSEHEQQVLKRLLNK